MADSQIETLIRRLARLAADAAERAEHGDGSPPNYWQGVSFGLHTALDEAQQLANPAAESSNLIVEIITDPNDVQDGTEPLPDTSTPFYAPDEADGDADDD